MLRILSSVLTLISSGKESAIAKQTIPAFLHYIYKGFFYSKENKEICISTFFISFNHYSHENTCEK